MASWLRTFQLKDLLSHEDVEPELAQELGKEAARRLRLRHPFGFTSSARLAEQFESLHDQEDFNSILEELYDEADERRVWIA